MTEIHYPSLPAKMPSEATVGLGEVHWDITVAPTFVLCSPTDPVVSSCHSPLMSFLAGTPTHIITIPFSVNVASGVVSVFPAESVALKSFLVTADSMEFQETSEEQYSYYLLHST